MVIKNKISFVFNIFKLVVLILVVSKTVVGQKRILLNHSYITKKEKLYNMDGAEVYFLINNDTIFLTKVDKYEFIVSRQLDSLYSNQSINNALLLVKTHKRIYVVDIPQNTWDKSNVFKLSLYKTPKYGSYSAVTFESISCTAPIIMMRNKERQKKYYKYNGF